MTRDSTLLARALEGDLSETERLEWLQAIKEDPALRAEWGRQAVLHGMLGPALEGEWDREQRIARCMAAVRRADQEHFLGNVRGRIRRLRFRRGMAWAAAAVLVVGLWIGLAIPRPLATVTRIGALGGDSPIAEGARFFKGDRLQIESGIVELDLAGRGRMVVEGPAELLWSSSLASILSKGRVLLNVNPRGHGYRLETPQGSIVDLGTEFGVFIDPSTGKVETHVLDGEVEALPDGGGGPVRLRKHEALRLSSSGGVRIPADQGAFYRKAPPRHGGHVRMLHWSMEPDSDGAVRSRTRGFGGEAAAMELRGGPQAVDGPFGAALHFDGKGAHAETSFRGVGGSHPRTVAFWVKVPRDFEFTEGFAVVSWGEFDPGVPGSVWQISINPLEKDGPPGRLRLGVHGGMVIGSTNLRDDRWHHVAVVLYPAESPEISQHVLLYLNGRVEPVSSRVIGNIDTNTEEATHGVWLARNITGGSAHGRFFRGAIDEVYIFDAALGHDEIRALMERNEPPPSEASRSGGRNDAMSRE